MVHTINRPRVALIALVLLVVPHQIIIHFGAVHWIIDLYTHFQLQILIAGVCMVLVLWFWSRSTLVALLGVVYACGLGWWVFAGTGFQVVEDTTLPITMYYQNVQYGQSEDNQQEQADVLSSYPASIYAFVEPGRAFLSRFEQQFGTAPVLHYEHGGTSCAVFVQPNKYTVRESEVYQAEHHDPICIVRFAFLDLYLVHPLPPLSKVNYVRQAAYFETLRTMIEVSKKEGREWLVMGDFNSTKYSALFRDSFGEYTTKQHYTWDWPSVRTIPIDHVFGSVKQTTLLYPALSSDHRGLGVVLH